MPPCATGVRSFCRTGGVFRLDTAFAPLRTARISALRQLVLQVPAPVIAGALGFHHTTTTRQHVKAAGPWSQYAGGDREP